MEFRVPATDKPTYFNKDTLLGGLIGFATLGIFGAAAGTAIGGYLGKNRMDKEAVEGKIVKEPTLGNAAFSKDTLIGGLAGGLGGHLLGLAAGVGILLAAPLLSIGAVAAVTAAASVVALATVGGILAGAFTGASKARATQDREFFEARQQGSMAPPSVARSQGQSQNVDYSVPTREDHLAREMQRRNDPATAQYLSGR